MVGETGLEPARPYDHQILSLRRLPVTPLPHIKAYWGQGATPGYATHYQLTSTIAKLLFSPDLCFYDIVPQVMTPRLAFVASALRPHLPCGV